MRILCILGWHRWHVETTARAGFVVWERCRGCGATRVRKGR
jgi:hypothetical protein